MLSDVKCIRCQYFDAPGVHFDNLYIFIDAQAKNKMEIRNVMTVKIPKKQPKKNPKKQTNKQKKKKKQQQKKQKQKQKNPKCSVYRRIELCMR
jgi:hypothetical protein